MTSHGENKVPSKEEIFQRLKTVFPHITRDQMMFEDTSEVESVQIFNKSTRQTKAQHDPDDWEWYRQSHPFPRPKPAELAGIAAILSNGQNAGDHIQAAMELYYRAMAAIESEGCRQEESFDDEERLTRKELRECSDIKRYVLFERPKDWDEAREYLRAHGCHLKTAKAFLRNYKELCIAFSGENHSEEDALQMYKIAIKQDAIRIPKRWLDHLIKQKKAKKSMGGKKSQQTRKHARAPKRVK